MTLRLPLFVLAVLFFTSCKKDSFITTPDASILISSDTLKFDTVFTTTGSTTQFVKIKNNNEHKLLISSISLAGGYASPFKLNIDGTASHEVYNIEVAANDSIYIYVSVTIPSSNVTIPFVVNDSIRVFYNGNSRYIQLEAYGQNAMFITNQTINGTQVWNPQLPVVVLESLTIRENGSLTLSPGTRMYFRNTAPIIVYGTLIVNGTHNNPVVFKGERLDEYYNSLPGSWPGIIFMPSSKNNVLTFAEIHNAVDAITVAEPSINSNPKITLQQSIISNAYNTGLNFRKTDAEVTNSLIVNCSKNILIQEGGNYNFIHCTVAGMNTEYFIRQNPVLILSNQFSSNNTTASFPLNAVFTNSIFWGNLAHIPDEIILDNNPAAGFSVTFQHCLYKQQNNLSDATVINCIPNQSPGFKLIDLSEQIFDFHIDNPFAPGIDHGINTGLLKDLDNNNRLAGNAPDIGAYEKQ